MGFNFAEAAWAAVPTHDYKALRATAQHGGGDMKGGPLGGYSLRARRAGLSQPPPISKL